jgi:hypothetical protein
MRSGPDTRSAKFHLADAKFLTSSGSQRCPRHRWACEAATCPAGPRECPASEPKVELRQDAASGPGVDGLGAMAQGYSELKNEVVSAANGVNYACRDTGSEGGVPLVLLQHFRGHLGNAALVPGWGCRRRGGRQ